MNFTSGNSTGIKLDLGTALSRNSRTLNNPIVGLLLAAGILARVAQAKHSSTASSAAALVNPWLQLQSIASDATPVQIAPSPVGAQPPYGYYQPPYPLAAPPSAYPWWYAVEPFSLYPINGHRPQIIHVHGSNEEHEEHKDAIRYPEDHETEHPQQEHYYHSHELETDHSIESGEQSAPGSYEAESENVDKHEASNEMPNIQNNAIKPVMESVDESKLEPVAILAPSSSVTAINKSSANNELAASTVPSIPANSTLLNEATRKVQSVANLLHKFEGNYSRIKTSDPIKQRQNQHQLILQDQQNSAPKNSVTKIFVHLNTTSASELLDEDRIAEASAMAPSQLEGTPLMLAMAGASNTMRRQQRPNEPNRQASGGRKGTTTTRRPSYNKNQNRQKPQQRKTTTFRPPVVSAYEDDEYEDEYTTPRYKPTRRSTTRRRPDYRRSTAPPRKYDDYDYDNYHTKIQSPVYNRRKPGGSVNIYNKNRNGYNNRKKPTMASAYDDDFDGSYGDDPAQYYSNDYAYRPAQAQDQIDYADYQNDKDDEENGDGFVARQGTTESPDYENESTTTTSAGTTVTSTTTTTATKETPATQTDTSPTNSTMPLPTGYPYGPGSNISFTYGPPVHPQPGYGYGPSNGNENISITYGPPTAGGDTGGGSATGGGTGHGSPQQYIAAGGPSLDWYNQYTKQNVFKRIQDLLTPNNFYSPQYDNDKYNYNDNTF